MYHLMYEDAPYSTDVITEFVKTLQQLKYHFDMHPLYYVHDTSHLINSYKRVRK